ncbi:phosphatase PAP2 family protein [Microvirga flavescens]|uniref:phosphatase PAP2 family protein n=1 Tax=Microvirga flavescens TaxID=2249811 RepID=UPI000DD6DB6F|nr:phosphatase PAP2 family protein [Microvirga flavescens]
MFAITRTPLLAVSLLAFASLHAEARDKPHYSVTIDATAIGAPPDAADASRDLETVLSVQTERTPKQEDQALKDARQSLTGFLEGMDAPIDKGELKKARRLFKAAAETLEEALAPVKSRFDRPRPFKTSANVKVCPARLPSSSSFPSTHAATGTLFAALLAHVAPERKADLEKRGLDYGWSRVVCGFHYPSDIEAGRTGGRLVADALLRDHAFAKRLEEVTPQLRKALGL